MLEGKLLNLSCTYWFCPKIPSAGHFLPQTGSIFETQAEEKIIEVRAGCAQWGGGGGGGGGGGQYYGMGTKPNIFSHSDSILQLPSAPSSCVVLLLSTSTWGHGVWDHLCPSPPSKEIRMRILVAPETRGQIGVQPRLESNWPSSTLYCQPDLVN